MSKSSSIWKDVLLEEVCDEITVGFVGTMAKEYVGEGIPFLRSLNVKPFRLDLSDIKFISHDFHQKLKKSALYPGDLIVVRTGYPGTSCVIPDEFAETNCADMVVIRTSGKVDAYYLSAIFNSAAGRASIHGRLVGVAQQHFNVSAAKKMIIRLPPIEIQYKISMIISSLNNLIENYRRRIRFLEEMSRALYREWFVHFRFPGHEDVEMVDSELGEIPEGWKITEISQIVNIEREGVNPSKHQDEIFAHYSFNACDNGKLPILQFGKEIRSNKYMVSNNYILLSKLNPRIPRSWMPILDHIYRGIASTDFLTLTPRDAYSTPFVYCLLSSGQFLERFTSLVTGTSTSHQRVKPDDFLKMKIPNYSKDVVHRFTKVVSPILQLQHNLRSANVTLVQSRDLLLPRLVSGKIDVSDMKKENPTDNHQTSKYSDQSTLDQWLDGDDDHDPS